MTRADWFVVLMAVMLLPLLYQHFWFSDQGVQQAVITVAEENPQTVSLDQPGTYRFQGKLGESVLEIRNHKIRFLESPCKGKVCIHGGWLKEAGDVLACLPNRITLRLIGSDPRFDAINF